VDYFQGAARLGGNGAVIVSGEDGKDRELRAGTILIATGQDRTGRRIFRLTFLESAIPTRSCIAVVCRKTFSEIVGIGQMLIRCGGTLNTIANMSFNTPTYRYAYKYAAFNGLHRLKSAERQAHVA
jgi:pyruvate/2-oxoglutarate dehydrogenase complex dihydrolipoamide dehydrogenase (E3) component